MQTSISKNTSSVSQNTSSAEDDNQQSDGRQQNLSILWKLASKRGEFTIIYEELELKSNCWRLKIKTVKLWQLIYPLRHNGQLPPAFSPNPVQEIHVVIAQKALESLVCQISKMYNNKKTLTSPAACLVFNSNFLIEAQSLSRIMPLDQYVSHVLSRLKEHNGLDFQTHLFCGEHVQNKDEQKDQQMTMMDLSHLRDKTIFNTCVGLQWSH